MVDPFREASGSPWKSLESWEVSVKALYRGALVLWLVSGFAIPYTGDTRKQTSTNNEEFLRANLVATKQIRLPQQWIQLGYETTGWNGEWRDAAKLIKVDKSPVTREWTADPNTGTSNRNEA